jgi:DNA-binding CsgD family transcriptional regulator
MVDDSARARRLFDESMELARKLDDEFSLAVCSHIYAMFLVGLGECAEAAAVVSVTTERFEQEANPFQKASYRFVLGAIDLAYGRTDDAEARMTASLGIFAPTDPSICYPIEGLALVAARRGQALRCVALIAATTCLRSSGTASTRVPGWWLRNLDRARTASLAMLNDGKVWDIEGHARGLTRRQLLDYALERGDRSLHPEPSALTYREHEVAVLVAKGLSNRRIAVHLQIADGTVSSHIKRIYAKLGIRSRTQLAAWIAAAHPRDLPYRAAS